MIRDESVLNLVNDVLFIRKDHLEDKRKDVLEYKENELEKRDNIVIKKEAEETGKLEVKDIGYDSEDEIINEDCKEEVLDDTELQEYIVTDSAQKPKLKKVLVVSLDFFPTLKSINTYLLLSIYICCSLNFLLHISP